MVDQPPTPQTPASQKFGAFLGFVLLLAFPVGVVIVFYRAYPAHHIEKKNPSFIDSIFANNLVLFAARLVLFSAAFVLSVVAVFVIYSIVRSMKDGKTLTKFGPFQIQEAEDLSADVQMWQNLWSQTNEENQELRERLEATDALLQEAFGSPEGWQPEEGTEPPGITP